MSQNKITFDVNDKKLAVIRPSANIIREAQKHGNLAWSAAIESKAPIRAKVDMILREQGLWDDDRENRVDTIRQQINENERKLLEGRKMKLSEARELALKTRQLRDELIDIQQVRNSLDNQTAESHKEQAQFDYLTYACTVYNDSGKNYFQSYQAYMDSKDVEVIQAAAKELALLIYDLDKNYEKNRVENKFLLQYGFVDEQLRLVNKQGQLVDEEGRLINEDGRYIDSEGNFVDINGNKVDAEGNPVVEFQGFVDDETGEVVGLKNEVVTEIKEAQPVG